VSVTAKMTGRGKLRRTHDELVAEAFKRPGVRAAYDTLQEQYAFFDECVKARKHAGLTQEDVAKHMGTSASAVARLESAGSGKKPSPCISTLQRYAAALGCRLVLKLEPLDEGGIS